MTEHIVGIILAGGRATRMGGGDKCLMPLTDKANLLDVVIKRLDRQVEAMALNANGDPARFANYGLPVLADDVDGFAGPLAGILAGLDWAAGLGASHVVSVAADTPFFPRDLVPRLYENRGPEGLALAANYDENGNYWRQPTFGIWPVALRGALRAALLDGMRKIVLWTDTHQAGEAVFGSADGSGATVAGVDPFFNVNTPEDLQKAQHLARHRGRA
ncbi:MAG: molybdenum cofactor guanylyltransferase MobA [Paracoccaceae bacterium]|jgi:molybdopterin-guanine dinucleotide biosynthesis protein A|nr:molybdenum cofactor guanylyltransferase MobA [Paracoccaceae bacterium]MDP7186607.1 molybdenum cofactor guanylyltransferase MobA [Paracoccaceae bacterium]